MKTFLRRYWHDIPFLALAIRAVWLASTLWGITTFLYFFLIVVPLEVKHFRSEKAQQEWKIKQKIAMKTGGGTNDGGYIWVTTITKINA